VPTASDPSSGGAATGEDGADGGGDSAAAVAAAAGAHLLESHYIDVAKSLGYRNVFELFKVSGCVGGWVGGGGVGAG
jgi:glycerate-2-kinase